VTSDVVEDSLFFMAVEPKRLLTYEDFLAFPDDVVRREIVQGEVLVTPAPSIRHQELIVRLCHALEERIRTHGGGRVFVSRLDVRLSEHDIVEPDVIFVAEDRLDIIQEKYMLGAPSLLIEVVSDPRTDRVRKRDLYARAGVPEYWIVDPDADRVEVRRLEGGRYRKPEILESGDTLTTVLLPGLRLDVSELLRR
jgi:Uma2 family endonuclease